MDAVKNHANYQVLHIHQPYSSTLSKSPLETLVKPIQANLNNPSNSFIQEDFFFKSIAHHLKHLHQHKESSTYPDRMSEGVADPNPSPVAPEEGSAATSSDNTSTVVVVLAEPAPTPPTPLGRSSSC